MFCAILQISGAELPNTEPLMSARYYAREVDGGYETAPTAYGTLHPVATAGFGKNPQTAWDEVSVFLWAQLLRPTQNNRCISSLGLPSAYGEHTDLGATVYHGLTDQRSSMLVLSAASTYRREEKEQFGLGVLNGQFFLAYPDNTNQVFHSYTVEGLREIKPFLMPGMQTRIQTRPYVGQSAKSIVALQKLIKSNLSNSNFPQLEWLLNHVQLGFMPLMGQLSTEETQKVLEMAGMSQSDLLREVRTNEQLRSKREIVNRILVSSLNSTDLDMQAKALDAAQINGLIPYSEQGKRVLISPEELKKKFDKEKGRPFAGFLPICKMIIEHPALRASLLGSPQASEDLNPQVSLVVITSIRRGVIGGEEPITPVAQIDDGYKELCKSEPEAAAAMLWNFIRTGDLL